jgi:mediator of RNA polymerase II transcription subunit 14
VPPTPLSTEKINQTLADIEDVMRYRLRMQELIPHEMRKYRIADGRVFFTVPHLFEVSLCVKGAKQDDGWFFVDVEFLFTVGGDVTGMQGRLLTRFNVRDATSLFFYLHRLP